MHGVRQRNQSGALALTGAGADRAGACLPAGSLVLAGLADMVQGVCHHPAAGAVRHIPREVWQVRQGDKGLGPG
jgi:hypothetical protein